MHVSFTQKHGVAQELSLFPPDGITYSFLEQRENSHRIIRSPIKGYMRTYEENQSDFIEAIISPIRTEKPWSLWVANFQEAVAFNVLGCPVPRFARISFLTRLLRRENFKGLLFFSRAGKSTLSTYGRVDDREILEKVSVVYPGIREFPDKKTRCKRNKEISLLFSGDFFRKGGANVVDAFERLQKDYGSISLRLVCDEKVDFNTPNIPLGQNYLAKIRSNPSIRLGRIPRDRLIDEILPSTDIFLMPSYVEAFGFAILEAMALGIPVISTNHFAIPEMVEHGRSGLLVDTSSYNCDDMFRGYVVNVIPEDFGELVTESIYDFLRKMIDDVDLRESLGSNGREVARSKFSIKKRNDDMARIYRKHSS